MTQLPRQLELNIAALSRGFRQALRYALKHDPQGTEETSPAWKTVAARQTLLLAMLSAVGQFLNNPPPPAPSAPELPNSQAEIAPALSLLDATNEAKAESEEEDGDLTEEQLRALLPPDIQRVREKILAVLKWPANNRREKRRQSLELQRLQGILERRLNQWKAELAAQPPPLKDGTAPAPSTQLTPRLQ